MSNVIFNCQWQATRQSTTLTCQREMLLAQASTHRKIPMDTHPSARTYIPKKRLEFALNSTDFLCCDYSCVKIYFEIQRLLPDGMAIL